MSDSWDSIFNKQIKLPEQTLEKNAKSHIKADSKVAKTKLDEPINLSFLFDQSPVSLENQKASSFENTPPSSKNTQKTEQLKETREHYQSSQNVENPLASSKTPIKWNFARKNASNFRNIPSHSQKEPNNRRSSFSAGFQTPKSNTNEENRSPTFAGNRALQNMYNRIQQRKDMQPLGQMNEKSTSDSLGFQKLSIRQNITSDRMKSGETNFNNTQDRDLSIPKPPLKGENRAELYSISRKNQSYTGNGNNAEEFPKTVKGLKSFQLKATRTQSTQAIFPKTLQNRNDPNNGFNARSLGVNANRSYRPIDPVSGSYNPSFPRNELEGSNNPSYGYTPKQNQLFQTQDKDSREKQPYYHAPNYQQTAHRNQHQNLQEGQNYYQDLSNYRNNSKYEGFDEGGYSQLLSSHSGSDFAATRDSNYQPNYPSNYRPNHASYNENAEYGSRKTNNQYLNTNAEIELQNQRRYGSNSYDGTRTGYSHKANREDMLTMRYRTNPREMGFNGQSYTTNTSATGENLGQHNYPMQDYNTSRSPQIPYRAPDLRSRIEPLQIYDQMVPMSRSLTRYETEHQLRHFSEEPLLFPEPKATHLPVNANMRDSLILESLEDLKSTEPVKYTILSILVNDEEKSESKLLREIKKSGRYMGSVALGVIMFHLIEEFGTAMISREFKEGMFWYKLSEEFKQMMNKLVE